MKRHLLYLLLVLVTMLNACHQNKYENGYVTSKKIEGSFSLIAKDLPALCIDAADYTGVKVAFENLRTDLAKVSGVEVSALSNALPASGKVVIAGTLGSSKWIDELARNGKLPKSELEGKWEKFIITTVEEPFPGIASALIIAGSDKRGTIFGIYDLSEKIGVSPWYFWADVPVVSQKELYVLPGLYSEGEPKVKYRGIFINDEAPALAGWVGENFGSFNHEFYAHVFELILRQKGNFLWPAMWGRAFYDDDSLNAVLANEVGVVIGTSHHEPLMRAHDEWRRYGDGPWNYEQNPEKLREFWTSGIERMGENESVITVGMRGDGDEPMSEGTAIALLEKIVRDQRTIIAETTGKDAAELPQSWALYKEVQDYYDKGMRVPEDITLLLCDDNWGNLRKLPVEEDRDRAGGFGIYYHFDYVGGPRNYKWLNTNQIERTWEQMHLAYTYGVDRLWLVNVGDIKPMEFPISFFLDYAWDPERIEADDLPGYYAKWSCQQFGSEYADEIADILAKYTKYNSRRKPEMLSPGTYSLDHFREFEMVVEDYNAVRDKAEAIYAQLGNEYRDAYFQLVLFPVQACANLNELYLAAALNKRYAEEGRASANNKADQIKTLFDRDAELTRQYHEDVAGGKWKHMMSQTHIGYRYWQEPRNNNMPEQKYIEVPLKAEMGIAVEGTGYSDEEKIYELPEFDRYNKQNYRIDIFNKGKEAFSFGATSDADWVKISSTSGEVSLEESIEISVDWKKVKADKSTALVTIKGAGSEEKVLVRADNTPWLEAIEGPLHLESNGTVSIEAANFSEAIESPDVHWILVPNLGRTGSAVTAFPANGPVQEPGIGSPHLEYPVFLKDTGKMKLAVLLSPTLNFHNSEGRRIAVSMDDQIPQVMNIHKGNFSWMWQNWVGMNIIYAMTDLEVKKPGKHVLNYWVLDPGLVVQKFVIQTGEVKRSYLGPPESYFKK